MFYLIVKDAWHVPSVIVFDSGIDAINYGYIYLKKNANAVSVEVVSRANSALIRKLR